MDMRFQLDFPKFQSKIKSFRDFPKWVENLQKTIFQKKPKLECFVLEEYGVKSTSYLKQIGFNNVYHLKGGILKYIEEIPENKACGMENVLYLIIGFVDHELNRGSFDMCFACNAFK